jgi:WD40 repeat protein
MVKLWDPVRDKLLREFDDGNRHSGPVECLAFSPDGKLLATAGGDLTVRIWEVATGRCRVKMKGHEGYVNDVAFSPEARTHFAEATTGRYKAKRKASSRICPGRREG